MKQTSSEIQIFRRPHKVQRATCPKSVWGWMGSERRIPERGDFDLGTGR